MAEAGVRGSRCPGRFPPGARPAVGTARAGQGAARGPGFPRRAIVEAARPDRRTPRDSRRSRWPGVAAALKFHHDVALYPLRRQQG